MWTIIELYCELGIVTSNVDRTPSIVHFLACKSSKHWAAKSRISEGMIDRSTFRVLDTVTATSLNSTFSNNLLTDAALVFVQVPIMYPIDVQMS